MDYITMFGKYTDRMYVQCDKPGNIRELKKKNCT